MNTETGELRYLNDLSKDQIEDLFKEDWIPVDEDDMTKKQKENMQVSLYDHRSILGKELTKNKKRKLKRQGLLK